MILDPRLRHSGMTGGRETLPLSDRVGHRLRKKEIPLNTAYSLPFLKIVAQPREALKQARNANWTFLVVTYLAIHIGVTELILLMAHLRPGAAVSEEMAHSLWIHVGTPALALVTSVVFALAGHGMARLLKGQGSMLDFLKICLFFSAAAKIPSLLTPFIAPLDWLISFWKIFLFIVAIKEIYSFTNARAVSTGFITYLLIGLAGFLITMGLMSAGSSRMNIMDRFMSGPKLGDMSTPADLNWTVETLEGQPVMMSQFKGKPLVINFWATWCPPCRMEMPSLQNLYNATKDKGIEIIAITDEDVATVRPFLAKNNYTFPIYIFRGRYPAMFEPSGLPTTFIVSPEGNIVASHVGAAKWDRPDVITFLLQLMTKTAPPIAS
jgi:thiol-disulfide isomerase/thioredoxin